MASLHVTDRQGQRHVLEGADGWRVMEILRDSGVGVEGICGGACDCASCHVIVAPEWAGRLHAPREEELLKLDELPAIETTSRLSCQILWDETLDGLTLTLAEID
jgi:ferredoxin